MTTSEAGKLETERLILRPLTVNDFEAVHSWGSNPINTRYMAWGPNSEEQTREFLKSVKSGRDLKLHRIFAPCVAANYGSYRVMERNGMRRKALRVKAFWSRVDKEWIDGTEYAILAEEYFTKPSNDVALIKHIRSRHSHNHTR